MPNIYVISHFIRKLTFAHTHTHSRSVALHVHWTGW